MSYLHHNRKIVMGTFYVAMTCKEKFINLYNGLVICIGE